MKINGEKIEGPNEEVAVIPRNGKDIVFRCRAVLNFDEFDKLVPEVPMVYITKIGTNTPVPCPEDKKYQKALHERFTKRYQWSRLKSLEATPGLSWEKVNINDPSTYDQLVPELKESGFTEAEIVMIWTAFENANSMNEDRIKEARDRFFAEEKRQKELALSSQTAAPMTT